MSKREEPFFNPFRDRSDTIKQALRRARKRARAEVVTTAPGGDEGGPPSEASRSARPPTPSAEAGRDLLAPAGTGADWEQFARAMADVRPLPPDPRVGSPRANDAPRPRVTDPDAEAVAQLADLVAGTGEFDISDTVEHVEGLARGVDRRLLRRLRRGEFSVQAHLDLHGLVRQDARVEVERFLTASRLRGRRCVLLVHGRGLNSKDQQPVLKPAVVSWLTRGRLAKMVLAFCTARPTDGGAGALYVLLRR